ncbi:GNAT family N-acetyltransferase [Azospirillum thermophilum]|uniref:GNAT family N-acetyltransferase n=1 Tax=Azospirillum thermophilum TaxID=2202148 RepID=A0A2S2CQR1_9PROT|nr:GNAT family N-acetyltransferase [Azospirillum thermophilum]AWK86816.1 GNAT family N-acetyltransferase [Azospirillum thermophilum]
MTTDPITLTVTDSVAPADDAAVIRGLTLFNEERHGRPHDRRAIAVIARDADGAVVGGLTGYTQWDWLYVDHLWAGEDRRRSGLGTRLMEAAEAEARARGCRWSRLYTYDFQAPGFYLKRGYRVWAEMEGYPPGHKQIWFRKDLD